MYINSIIEQGKKRKVKKMSSSDGEMSRLLKLAEKFNRFYLTGLWYFTNQITSESLLKKFSCRKNCAENKKNRRGTSGRRLHIDRVSNLWGRLHSKLFVLFCAMVVNLHFNLQLICANVQLYLRTIFKKLRLEVVNQKWFTSRRGAYISYIHQNYVHFLQIFFLEIC